MALRDLADSFPVYPDETRLNERYKVLRKLGRGVFSDTWLVKDEQLETGKYFAAKILTRDGTRRHNTGEMQELVFLKKLAECEDIKCLPVLHDDFIVKGPRGDHLCFIMTLLSTDVASLRRQSPTKSLASYLVKSIISLVLEGLQRLHDLNIVHTDVKPDNILFGGVDDNARVEQFLTSHPLEVKGEFGLNGTKNPIVQSQPIPHQFNWNTNRRDAELITICLVDLGQAEWAGKQPTVNHSITPSLRAPEVILRSTFGPKIDIWMVGCMTFELLTGNWLFDPQGGDGDWTVEDDHLAKMMELTGEDFTPDILQCAQRREEFFDESGKLLRVNDILDGSIESTLRSCNVLTKGEVKPAAQFIRSCLRLDPSKRPSAKELQLAPWLKDASRS